MTKATVNKWLWQRHLVIRKQFPLVEVYKKSRKVTWVFWTGVILGLLPYLVHQSGFLN